jgi:hypothetical protein
VTKEPVRKIAAIQLTIVEYRPGNVPVAGGALVSRHHEREGEEWGKGVTISSMMDWTITCLFSSQKPLESNDVSPGPRQMAE